MMKIVEYLSKGKPFNAWECQTCSSITNVKKCLPAPVCEYCRRKEEKKP